MPLNFIKYADEGSAYINRVADELGYTEERTLKVVKAFFHALRNHIQISESLNLISELPMLLKAMYVEHWQLRKDFDNDKMDTLDDFICKMMEAAGRTYFFDNLTENEAIKSSKIIFNSLKKYIAEEELNSILNNLPKPIKTHFMEQAADIFAR